MTRFVKLATDGGDIWVNPDRVCAIEDVIADPPRSELVFGSDYTQQVKGSQTEVVAALSGETRTVVAPRPSEAALIEAALADGASYETHVVEGDMIAAGQVLGRITTRESSLLVHSSLSGRVGPRGYVEYHTDDFFGAQES